MGGNDALMVKLKNILQNVTTQESVLQKKTSKIETWHKMHQSALSKACKIKQQLIEFKPINEAEENEETKQKKTKNKHSINMALDELTNELKQLNDSEVKFRSTESMDELKQHSDANNKLQNKYNALFKQNNALLKENENNKQRIKSLTDQQHATIESIKKELFDRHKDYVENLQNQHLGHIKSMEIQNQNALQYEISKLKIDSNIEIEKQLKEMETNKNEEFESQQKELQNKIDSIQAENDKLHKNMTGKDEILANFVNMNKEHQILSNEWNENKKMLNMQILEMKQNEMRITELMLEQKNENNQLQQNAVKHSLNVIKASENMHKLNLELLESKKLQQTHLKKIDAMNEKYKSLTTQYAISKQEKIALIKEVKKLRKIIIEKDDKKNEILSKMSENEILHNQQIEDLNQEIC